MTSPLEIKISREAQAQIEETAAWWALNRPLAPGAVRQDLDRVLGLLSVDPGIGARARRATLEGGASRHAFPDSLLRLLPRIG